MRNKKTKHIKNVPVVCLSTFGHCGIDWLHSLIDSHKQLLIMPPLSFFRKIDILKKKNFYLNDTLSEKKITNIISDVVIKNADNNSGSKNTLERNRILKKNQSKLKFKRYINNFLIMEKELDIEKRLFFAIHYAYSKINKIKISNIKKIVAHEHAPWNCRQFEKHFNSKFIFMVRDPRAIIGGSFKKFQASKNLPINFPFDITLSFMISAQEFCQNLPYQKILIIRNEDMVKNLKSEMKKISKFLNIKFNKSLLKETFLGKKWFGESSYLSKIGDLKKKVPKNYYSPHNISKRWRGFLSKNTIFLIETVYEKIMIQYKYKFDNKLNMLSRFQGYLAVIFKNHEFKNFFSFIKFRYIKGIIRRIFIVFFSKYSRKIFDIV